MKRLLATTVGFLIVWAGLAHEADAQRPLRQSTSRVVRICGVVSVSDGFTPVTTLALSTADEAEALRENTATLDISGATWAAVTGADGCYSLTLDTTATNTVGELGIQINDDSLVLPVWEWFQVYEEAVYDNLFASGAVGPLTAAAVNQEADTALTDYDPPTNTEMNARTLLAADYFDPAADTVANVTTTANLTTNNDKAGYSISGTLTTLDALDTAQDTQHSNTQAILGTPIDFGSGTSTLAANLRDMADNGTATYDRSTDSLQAIRARGDAAWTTGGAGGCSSGAVCTTVATAPTTTSFTATAAPNFDTQLDGWAVYFEDNGDADSYCLRKITGVSTGTISYDEACPFTVAAGDTVEFLGGFLDEGVNVTTAEGTDFTDVIDARLTAIHLDRLFAADYDPASKPGSATALLNELVEDDAGVSRFTTNALEQAPTGGGTAQTGDAYAYLVSNLGAAGVAATEVGGDGDHLTAADDAVMARLGAPAGASVSADIAAINSALAVADQNIDDIEAGLGQTMLADSAIITCTVNDANTVPGTTTIPCLLTNRAGTPLTKATGDLDGLPVKLLDADELGEARFIDATTWDGVNNELVLTIAPALPAVPADGDVILIGVR